MFCFILCTRAGGIDCFYRFFLLMNQDFVNGLVEGPIPPLPGVYILNCMEYVDLGGRSFNYI